MAPPPVDSDDDSDDSDDASDDVPVVVNKKAAPVVVKVRRQRRRPFVFGGRRVAGGGGAAAAAALGRGLWARLRCHAVSNAAAALASRAAVSPDSLRGGAQPGEWTLSLSVSVSCLSSAIFSTLWRRQPTCSSPHQPYHHAD